MRKYYADRTQDTSENSTEREKAETERRERENEREKERKRKERAKIAARVKIRKDAEELLHRPHFLGHLLEKFRELGLVGEEHNALILFLAGLTRYFHDPVSVLVRGLTSSGKSHLVKTVLQLFPQKSVLNFSSITDKAFVRGRGNLTGKLIFIAELRGAADATYLLRLGLTEDEIVHEVASGGIRKRTEVFRRTGRPVLFSTFTEGKIFADFSTRHLAVAMNESTDQTKAVIRAALQERAAAKDKKDLRVWRRAFRLLARPKTQFVFPKWFPALANNIPAGDPRARRDVYRFLGLLQAVALCESYGDGRRDKAGPIPIKFTDYCVAYKIAEPAFATTYLGVSPRIEEIADAVSYHYRKHDRGISIKELIRHLGWGPQPVYRWTKAAVESNVIAYEPRQFPRNEKRLLPGVQQRHRFLPDPGLIMRDCDLGDVISYFNPIIGRGCSAFRL